MNSRWHLSERSIKPVIRFFGAFPEDSFFRVIYQSMHAGEQTCLERMLDWEGKSNRSYDEYKTSAAEFLKIEAGEFPDQPQPDMALAFSSDPDFRSTRFMSKERDDYETQRFY